MKARRKKGTSLLPWAVGSIWGCVGMLVSVILGAWLFYYGWCWGWYGRDVFFLQYLFQCRCPAGSEEVRFRPYKVLVSACVHPFLEDISPSGRFILVDEFQSNFRILRIDLETGEIRNLGLKNRPVNFLDDDLLLVTVGYRESYLLWDLSDDTQVILPFAIHRYKQPLDQAILEVLSNAERVIVVYPQIVALGHDYKQYPERSLVIETEDDKDQIIEALTDLGISFQVLPFPYQTGKTRGARYSQNGKFWADSEGLHLEQTGQLIASAWQPRNDFSYGFGPQGWVRNDQAVIYGEGGYWYVINFEGFYSTDYLPFPRPILLLEVPLQYLPSPTVAP